jgi:pimeloyl-ACP methyl ester carboxylesterase
MTEEPIKKLPRPRRIVQKTLWIAGGLFLFMLMAVQAVPMFFAKYDNPARLRAPIFITATNGYTIRWAEKVVTNSRLTLVFIHGSPGGAGIWATQFKNPFPEATLVAYDRPGYGGSKPARAHPQLQEQVDGLMAFLPYATTNRVLLIGHSYGSPIALLAALEHPDKVGGVLLIGGDVDPTQEKLWKAEYIFGWRVTSWMLPRSLRQCSREMLTIRVDLVEVQKLLPQLSVPVVMLHGDQDPLVPVENVTWLEQQLAAQRKSALFAKIILPGVNHFIPWEHPAEVTRAIGLLEGMASGPSMDGGR